MIPLYTDEESSLQTASSRRSNYKSKMMTPRRTGRTSPVKKKSVRSPSMSSVNSRGPLPPTKPFQKSNVNVINEAPTRRKRRPTVREIRNGASPSPRPQKSNPKLNSSPSMRSLDSRTTARSPIPDHRDDNSLSTGTNFECDDSTRAGRSTGTPGSYHSEHISVHTPNSVHSSSNQIGPSDVSRGGNYSKSTEATVISSQLVSILSDGSEGGDGEGSTSSTLPSTDKLAKTVFGQGGMEKKSSDVNATRAGCALFECANMSIKGNNYLDVKRRFFTDGSIEKEQIEEPEPEGAESRIQAAYQERDIDVLFTETKSYIEHILSDKKKLQDQLEQDPVRMSASKSSMLFEEVSDTLHISIIIQNQVHLIEPFHLPLRHTSRTYNSRNK